MHHHYTQSFNALAERAGAIKRVSQYYSRIFKYAHSRRTEQDSKTNFIKNMGNGEGFQAACTLCFICISLIVYLIQLANNPTPAPGPSGGVVANSTAHHSCAHSIFVHNKTYTLECGGSCKVEDGICNPEYDGCVGKKYKKVKCKNGDPCIYSKGRTALSTDCEGLCYPDGYCGDKKTTISNGEMEFHITMSVVYSILLVSISALVYFAGLEDETRKTMLLWPFLCAVYFIISWSFTIAAAGDKAVGKQTQYSARFITMLIVGILTFPAMVGYLFVCMREDPTNRMAHFKLFMMYLTLVAIDIMHCVIGQNQAWLIQIDALHPNVSKESKCYENEYLAYVYGVLIFGFFTYALTLADLVAKARQMKNIESVHLFLFQLSIPSFITWILFISFGYSCKDTGITKLFQFGIAFTVFYMMFIFFYVSDWVKHHVLRKPSDTSNTDQAAVATATAVKLEDAETGDSSVTPVAVAWAERIEIMHHGRDGSGGICGKFCNVSILGLMIVGAQFMLVGYYFYYVREEVKQELNN